MVVSNSFHPHDIVAFCGLAGAGKSTAAKLLAKKFGYTRRPMSYPLKAMVAALNIDWKILDGTNEEKSVPLDIFHGRSIRHVLQTLGTEWGRNLIHPDIWTTMWEHSLTNLPKVVCDDIRFPNEVEMIHRLGGRIIRINRNTAGSLINPTHASENIDILKWDCVIENNGSLEELEMVLRSHVQV